MFRPYWLEVARTRLSRIERCLLGRWPPVIRSPIGALIPLLAWFAGSFSGLRWLRSFSLLICPLRLIWRSAWSGTLGSLQESLRWSTKECWVRWPWWWCFSMLFWPFSSAHQCYCCRCKQPKDGSRLLQMPKRLRECESGLRFVQVPKQQLPSQGHQGSGSMSLSKLLLLYLR